MDETFETLPTEINEYLSTLEADHCWDPMLFDRFWDIVFITLAPLVWKVTIYPQPDDIRRERASNLAKCMSIVSMYGQRFYECYGMDRGLVEDLRHFFAMAPTRYTSMN